MFVKSTPSKVKFVDQQLDDYVLENSVLKSKLHSKMEALSIMSRELDKCAMERDRYRLLVEQLRNKRSPGVLERGTRGGGRAVSGGELLAATRDQNNQLKLEVEGLRTRYEEAARDVAALRRQLRAGTGMGGGDADRGDVTHNEQLIKQLEQLNNKYMQLRRDLSAALDEKEELAADRDYYQDKVQRLNRHMSCVLAGNTADGQEPQTTVLTIDVDSMLTENSQLQERLAQQQVEAEMLKHTLAKYKSLLENRVKKDGLNLNNGNLDVTTQQQVREYLEKAPPADVAGCEGREGREGRRELRALCRGLFDALNDKAIALQHQRQTNRLLANRISDLEKTLECWSSGEKYIPVFPSQLLLDEFLPNSQLIEIKPSVKFDHKSDKSDQTIDREDSKSQSENSDNSDNKRETSIIKRGTSDNKRVKYDRNCTDEEVLSEDVKSVSIDGFSEESAFSRSSKIVLPPELEDMVREALEQIRPR